MLLVILVDLLLCLIYKLNIIRHYYTGKRYYIWILATYMISGCTKASETYKSQIRVTTIMLLKTLYIMNYTGEK